MTGPAVIRVEDDGAGRSKRRNRCHWRPLGDLVAQHDLYLAIERRATRGTIIDVTAA